VSSLPSVVVASRQQLAQLAACLDALAPQCERLRAEVVVARDPAAGPLPDPPHGIPNLRVVSGPPGATIPLLRGLGLAASTGDPVALTEDHLVPADDWLDRLFAGFTPEVACVGGCMANVATGSVTDWAAYFADYGFYSVGRPDPADPPLLTDANVAYRRNVVAGVADWAMAGAWENVVHDRLLAQGHRTRLERAARVYHRHHYRFASFLRNRFEHGRDYATSRLAEAPGTNRLLRAASAPLLVPVLFARIARASWREAPTAWLAAAPVTLAFLAGWAAGEAVGYLSSAEDRPLARM
jgi:hypothetical protein